MRASAGSRMGGSVGSGINGSPTDSVINNSGIN